MSVRSRSARLSLAANAGSRSSGYAVASCRVTLPITPRGCFRCGWNRWLRDDDGRRAVVSSGLRRVGASRATDVAPARNLHTGDPLVRVEGDVSVDLLPHAGEQTVDRSGNARLGIECDRGGAGIGSLVVP